MANFTKGGGRTYSAADDRDILSRFNKGETAAEIGKKYNVSMRAMYRKIDRLLERVDLNPKQAERTERTCLLCHKTFLSTRPKSDHRRCMSCKDAIQDMGNSFLTIFNTAA